MLVSAWVSVSALRPEPPDGRPAAVGCAVRGNRRCTTPVSALALVSELASAQVFLLRSGDLPATVSCAARDKKRCMTQPAAESIPRPRPPGVQPLHTDVPDQVRRCEPRDSRRCNTTFPNRYRLPQPKRRTDAPDRESRFALRDNRNCNNRRCPHAWHSPVRMSRTRCSGPKRVAAGAAIGAERQAAP